MAWSDFIGKYEIAKLNQTIRELLWSGILSLYIFSNDSNYLDFIYRPDFFFLSQGIFMSNALMYYIFRVSGLDSVRIMHFKIHTKLKH